MKTAEGEGQENASYRNLRQVEPIWQQEGKEVSEDEYHNRVKMGKKKAESH